MKTKGFVLVLCLIGFASMAKANTQTNSDEGTAGIALDGRAYLVDDGSSDGVIDGAVIEILDDGVPVALSEEDAQTSQVASADGSAGGCRIMTGMASIYGLNKGKGDSSRQKTASGGRLNTGAMTAAMLRVPLGKTVEVTRGGNTVKVRVNDRGPYARGRIIDLTPAAARAVGLSVSRGVGRVQVKVCN